MGSLLLGQCFKAYQVCSEASGMTRFEACGLPAARVRCIHGRSTPEPSRIPSTRSNGLQTRSMIESRTVSNGPDVGDDHGPLEAPRWSTLLSDVAEATGLAVSPYAAEGVARVGPCAPGPLAAMLEREGGWRPGGPCAAEDARAAGDAIASGRIVAREPFEALGLRGVPVALGGEVVGALALGWVPATALDEAACGRVAGALGILDAEL